MNICIYGAASELIDKSYIEAGELLGEVIARRGHSVVFGGGAEGMMGAAARGCKRAGGRLIGISPSFFKVDGVLYDNCDEFYYTETMRQRKQLLEEKSDGFIVTPGGIGTFDELFEILSLRQLKRHSKPILIYNINGYYDPMLAMLNNAAQQNFMKKENLSLISVEAEPEKALEYFEGYKADEKTIEQLR